MDEDKKKEGMTVQELEGMAKKYRFELVFCLAFILAGVFAYLFSMEGWCIFTGAIGGILGVCLPKQMEKFANYCFGFVLKQEKITQIVIGVILLVISVFLSPIIFLIMGFMSGIAICEEVSKHEGSPPQGGNQ